MGGAAEQGIMKGTVIGAPNSLPYAVVNLTNHACAVIVWGHTQKDADIRAEAIAKALTRLEDED